ncbi:class I SAM-dependent methyltransferase [Lolliginicoccus suaedae]|uniref:class I SAM-dependent methyltransferase n=1 Tax=Lolliginicoccus suaedae TaxID=2605429 RepID=UPI0011ED684B|nr:class I SAM-dependent methyltransferase [Lolliginicoccus suaedae]
MSPHPPHEPDPEHTTVSQRRVTSPESDAANRAWWDHDAAAYHDEHADFLGVDSPAGEFIWCPESLHEGDMRLLGDISGKRILEIGCGSAPCSRWLTSNGATAIGLDISTGMLDRARGVMARGGPQVPLVQASAERLPFASETFDAACSAFGGVPFVADSARVMREVARVLRPGAPWVFSINHPMRWMFPDDPGPRGLTVVSSYFDRSPYVEVDRNGIPAYVEHHRTMGDRVREIVAAGLVLEDVIEPEWPEWLDREWGQWSPLRGWHFPGTAIFCTRKPAA